MSIAKPIAVYGYHISVPETDSLDFIHDLTSINDTLVEPIQIYCITPAIAMSDLRDVQVIIGFIPENHLSANMIHLDSLREFIIDNPMFDGVELDDTSEFYAGFVWKDDIESEVESDAESTDCESTDDSDDYASSDISDDCDESNDKSLSHYITKYYI